MTLEDAKKIVFEAKPEFANFYVQHGNKSWAEYAKEIYTVCAPTNQQKQTEFLKAFEKVLFPLLGVEKTGRAVRTLKINSLVSTADHHGILCHPFFSNATLMRGRSCSNISNNSIVALTCGGISLSNSSYPRGIFFHDHDLTEVRLPFATLRGRRRSLYGLPSLSRATIQKQVDRIDYLKISENEKHKLTSFLKKIIAADAVWDQELFSSQLTIINDVLWNELFGMEQGNLVYLEIETLVRELLLTHHLDSETLIHDIIFDSIIRNTYIQNYEGIIGAHTTAEQKGSHIFWYIDEIEDTRKQLFVHNNALESLDGRISIPLIPHVIRDYLLRHELLPSMAFCYSIVSFYYGITLGGGFSQIQYLGEMKEAFRKIAGKQICDTETTVFTGEFVMFGISDKTTTKAASLIDGLLYGGDNLSEAISKEIKSCTIQETLDLMMPEYLEIITGTRETITDLPYTHQTFHV